ncbi:MAG: pirin family protein [Campylobacterales bacterium]|nr:pirin family protein [Campylobacterales bacterium]
MFKHIPFASLYTAEHDGLKSRYHFSFAEYHNPLNVHYGVLRVMNDDIISPQSGFDTHPHYDMEIFTYVLRGTLTHQDSMGHKEELTKGTIQYMSAGTGISHSELNEGEEEVHLIQTWIFPSQKGLNPGYKTKRYGEKERLNRWLHLMGRNGVDSVIPINQDVNIYVTQMESHQSLLFGLGSQRQLYVKVMEGEAMINDKLFQTGDAGKSDEDLFVQTKKQSAHILVIEMAKR